LIAAGVPLLGGQPFHVWYPFALTGFILTGVNVPIWFLANNVYQRAELEKKDLA
jgi:hypothetical protein